MATACVNRCCFDKPDLDDSCLAKGMVRDSYIQALVPHAVLEMHAGERKPA